MSLSQKRGTNQANRSGIGFGCQTTKLRHYIKIAEWALSQENVQAVLQDDRLSREAKATYAYIAWFNHRNGTPRFSEEQITSRYREIGKLMEAMEYVLGRSLEEV